jgi:hypothetical protein
LDVTRLPTWCYGGPMPRLGTDSVPEGFEETWEALIDLAVRPLVPAPLLAAQALEVTRGADWPVRRAAMEALLRRAKSAESEEHRRRWCACARASVRELHGGAPR